MIRWLSASWWLLAFGAVLLVYLWVGFTAAIHDYKARKFADRVIAELFASQDSER